MMKRKREVCVCVCAFLKSTRLFRLYLIVGAGHHEARRYRRRGDVVMV